MSVRIEKARYCALFFVVFFLAFSVAAYAVLRERACVPVGVLEIRENGVTRASGFFTGRFFLTTKHALASARVETREKVRMHGRTYEHIVTCAYVVGEKETECAHALVCTLDDAAAILLPETRPVLSFSETTRLVFCRSYGGKTARVRRVTTDRGTAYGIRSFAEKGASGYPIVTLLGDVNGCIRSYDEETGYALMTSAETLRALREDAEEFFAKA